MNRLLPLLLLASTISCAPLPTRTAAPTRVTTSVIYTTGITAAGADNPVLAAVVAIAPTAPTTDTAHQPWRAEEIAANQVTIRSRATVQDTTTFNSFARTLPQEMTFTAISSSGTTTLTGTYSSAYAATAQFIFDQLARRFTRVP